jgi:hypothetical protein
VLADSKIKKLVENALIAEQDGESILNDRRNKATSELGQGGVGTARTHCIVTELMKRGIQKCVLVYPVGEWRCVQ